MQLSEWGHIRVSITLYSLPSHDYDLIATFFVTMLSIAFVWTCRCLVSITRSIDIPPVGGEYLGTAQKGNPTFYWSISIE